MNCARNCENLLNFVKVIPKTLLVPFFSGHGVEAGPELEVWYYQFTKRKVTQWSVDLTEGLNCWNML